MAKTSRKPAPRVKKTSFMIPAETAELLRSASSRARMSMAQMVVHLIHRHAEATAEKVEKALGK